MPSQMTASQQQRFAASMQEQGVGVTRTTKGFFLRLPNGESTTVHFTNSDVRAKQNLFAVLRRAGVRHPEDPKNVTELPDSITKSGQPAPRTRRSIEEYVAAVGFPDRVAVLPIVKETGMEHVTITRALYHMEFLPTKGKRGARDWLTPDYLLERKPQREPKEVEQMPIYDEEPEAEKVGLLDREVERVLANEGREREFVDDVDSWVVDLSSLPRHLTLGDYFDSLDATGLQYEIRVWR